MSTTTPATTAYPEGLSAESAFYACDGPRDQQERDLRRIAKDARAHGTPESIALADEAECYLEWGRLIDLAPPALSQGGRLGVLP